MNRGLIYLSVCFLIGCVIINPKFNTMEGRHIQLDKVKMSISGFGVIGEAKGYVHVVRDSSIHFKFWGPLGIEFAEGTFDHSFIVHSFITNTDYSNLLAYVENLLGLKVDRRCVENLLLGESNLFLENVRALNAGMNSQRIKSFSSGFVIFHPFKDNSMEVHYSYRSRFPYKISLVFKQGSSNMNIHITYLSVHIS